MKNMYAARVVMSTTRRRVIRITGSLRELLLRIFRKTGYAPSAE